MSKKKRYLWLDLVKILACFFVIVNHSHGLLMRSGITDAMAIYDAIFFSICKVAVPLFVMTTGYLILQKETTWKKTFLRILRVFVPLLLFSAYYYISAFRENGTVLNFLRRFIEGPQTVSQWYLYMLIGLYLVAPFVVKIVKDSSNTNLLMFVLLFLIAPAAASFIKTVSNYTFSSYLFNAFFPHAIGYLVAGCALTRIPLKCRYFCGALISFVLAILIFVISTVSTYFETGKMVYTFDSWVSLPVTISSLSVFYIFRFLFENKDFKEKTEKIISEISATTFGVYLIHLIAINKIFYSNVIQAVYQINPFLGVIATQIACFVICSAVVYVLRKIPGIKWFL